MKQDYKEKITQEIINALESEKNVLHLYKCLRFEK